MVSEMRSTFLIAFNRCVSMLGIPLLESAHLPFNSFSVLDSSANCVKLIGSNIQQDKDREGSSVFRLAL